MVAPASAAQPRPPLKALQNANGVRDKLGADTAEADADETAALATQQRIFDSEMKERAELLRQAEVLDTVFLAQMKHDDDMLKAWIKMI